MTATAAPSLLQPARRPEWLKVRLGQGANYTELRAMMRDLSLHTVCEEARCPNIGECWNSRTATFMILGEICTRACGFCAVITGHPLPVDFHEPERVAEAVQRMGLRHVVITSVNRDDVPDGGATVFAATIRTIQRTAPGCTIEVLTPDFEGNDEALSTVIAAAPDIFNHNLETTRRLTRRVRRRARYDRSLAVLRRAKDLAPTRLTKSGLMLGLGETYEEIVETLRDLKESRVDIVTIGQYLQPDPNYLPIERYATPAEFAQLKEVGSAMGFRHVESGPLVRSSYHAGDHAALLSNA